MANHDDLNLDELKGLIESRLKEFLDRRPEPSVILELLIKIMEVINYSRADFILDEMADQTLTDMGYVEDEKGRWVKTTGYDEPKGGDIHESTDKS